MRAKSKKQANEIKEAYSRATEGTPLVVLGDGVLDEDLFTLVPSIRNNFIAPDILECRRAIINGFLTEIGIRNVSVQKKERLVSSETSENNDETSAIANIIYENLAVDFENVRAITGWTRDTLDVALRYDYTDAPEGGDREND